MTGKKKPAKRAKTKKAKATRQPGVLTVDLGANLVPADGVTCGCYIRSLVMMGKSTEEILALVGKHFPKSTAKGSDVSWTRARLRAAGKKLPGSETLRRGAAPSRRLCEASRFIEGEPEMTDRKDRFTWKMGDLEITPPPTAAYAWTKADIADTAREAEMAGHTGRCKPGKPMKAVTARPKVRKPARFSRG